MPASHLLPCARLRSGGIMATLAAPVASPHSYRDGTLATPNLTPNAVAYYNGQPRRAVRPAWVLPGKAEQMSDRAMFDRVHRRLMARVRRDETRKDGMTGTLPGETIRFDDDDERQSRHVDDNDWSEHLGRTDARAYVAGREWRNGGQVDDIPRSINQLLQRR
jgi:hypothetical protein